MPSAISQIEEDLDWREGELASIKLILKLVGVTESQRTVLYRAAWALLYAHYEGFCKFALSVYFDSITSMGITCSKLDRGTLLFAVDKPIRNMRGAESSEFLDAILTFRDEHLDKVPRFPEIDTKSNLWPSTLKELLEAAAIQLPILDNHDSKIKTLVSRRNKIAHGERDLISEYSYYVSYEDAVREILYELALAIDDRLSELAPRAS